MNRFHAEVWVPSADDPVLEVKKALEPFSQKLLRSGWWNDWEIGGRWSGAKVLCGLDKHRVKKFFATCKTAGWDRMEPTGEMREKAQDLFIKMFPEYPGIIPAFREETFTGEIDDIEPVDLIHPDLSAFTLVLPNQTLHRAMKVNDVWYPLAFDGRIRPVLTRHKIKTGFLVTVDYGV